MQPTSTNGAQTSPREMLESLRLVIEKLEADLLRQQQEIQQLRTERDDYAARLTAMKEFFQDLPEWENFDPADYTVTSDDIFADLRSK
jgi:molecular chaperone GrpE (heat shock protein)